MPDDFDPSRVDSRLIEPTSLPELPHRIDPANPEHADAAHAYFVPSGVERFEHTPKGWKKKWGFVLVMFWAFPFAVVGYEVFRGSPPVRAVSLFGIMMVLPVIFSVVGWARWRLTKSQAIEIDHNTREVRFENFALQDRFIPRRQPLITMPFDEILDTELATYKGNTNLRIHVQRGKITVSEAIEGFHLLAMRLRTIAADNPQTSPRPKTWPQALLLVLIIGPIVALVCWLGIKLGWV